MEYLPKNENSARYKIENKKLKFKKENHCTSVFMEIRLNWDGTISLCFNDETNSRYVSGNIFTDRVDDIIFGEEFIEARKKSLDKSLDICLKCEGYKSIV